MTTINIVGNNLSGQTGTGKFVGDTGATLTHPIITAVLDTNGNTMLGFNAIASSVNNINFQNAATGFSPSIATSGSDPNIQLNFSCKGTGGFNFTTTTGVNIFTINNVSGTPVNAIALNNSITGAAPAIFAYGTDTNIGLYLEGKGTGNVNLANEGGLVILNASGVASAVNNLQVVNSITGFGPSINAIGSDTNIPINFNTKGTGSFLFYIDNVLGAGITGQASAVNYLTLANNATGFGPTLYANGSDTNIQMFFNCKGTGGFLFNDSNSNKVFQLTDNASAVNYLNMTNASTGNAPAINAIGSDTNVGLFINAQAAGHVVISNESFTAITTFVGVASAANGIQITNVVANSGPIVAAVGSDTAIALNLNSKGGSPIVLNSSLATTPANSASASLSVGTAYQNTAAYDVVVTVYLIISGASSGSLLLGVGSTITPSQQTIVNSSSTNGYLAIPIYIPAGYYAKLSTSGTITATISGQMTMAV